MIALVLVEHVGVALNLDGARPDEDRAGRRAQLAEDLAVGGMPQRHAAPVDLCAAVDRRDHRGDHPRASVDRLVEPQRGDEITGGDALGAVQAAEGGVLLGVGQGAEAKGSAAAARWWGHRRHLLMRIWRLTVVTFPALSEAETLTVNRPDRR